MIEGVLFHGKASESYWLIWYLKFKRQVMAKLLSEFMKSMSFKTSYFEAPF